MITYGDLRSWDAGALTTASEALEADLRTLERARDTLADEAVPSTWEGTSRDAAEQRQAVLLGQVDRHLEEVTDFERAVFSQQPVVQRIVDEVADIDTTASEQEFAIDADDTVTDVADPPTFESARIAERYGEERVRLRDALVRRIEDVLDDAFAVDSALVDARPDSAWGGEEPEAVLDPQVERAWSQMSEDERREAVLAMVEEIARERGIDDVEVRIEDLEDKNGDGRDDDPDTNSYGSWNEDDHVLRIDLNDLDDPGVVIDTVAHEMRHAEQHDAVDDLNAPLFGQDEDIDLPPGADLDDVRDWDENFDGDNYIRPEDDFEGYQDQPVERDAREAGSDYLDDYDLDDLERHQEAS